MATIEIPQTPEKMFLVVAVIFGVIIIVGIIYAIYQAMNR